MVFLLVPRELRLARLRERERRRYGEEAIAPGGALHAAHVAFMAWAADYDEGGEDMRSRRLHEQWLSRLPCPSLRLEGPLALEEQVARLAKVLAGNGREP